MQNAQALRCASCSKEVVADVTSHEVITIEGEHVPFRRHTDYVVCACLSSYRVTDLREVVAHVEARMRSNAIS
jgi:hypothetical protein